MTEIDPIMVLAIGFLGGFLCRDWVRLFVARKRP
jgi:hypothetical protein